MILGSFPLIMIGRIAIEAGGGMNLGTGSLEFIVSLPGSNGGRVDREVSHPGPSQIRTCPTRASGSSNLQVCYVPTVVCTILTRGSG